MAGAVTNGPGSTGPEPAPTAEERAREAFGARLVARIPRSWATWTLAATLVSAHFVVGLVPWSRGNAEWWGVLVGRRGPRLLNRFGAMRTRALDRGELYRLVSSAFLHADGLHLLVNVASLLVVGRIVEAVYGPTRMLWIFLTSAISGASASWLLGNTEISVGASGGVFGLLGALFIFGWRHRTELPDDIGRVFRRRVAVLVALNLALGIPLRFIDDYAHIGGLFAGVVSAMLLSHGLHGERRGLRVSTVLLAVLQGLAVGRACQRVAGNWFE